MTGLGDKARRSHAIAGHGNHSLRRTRAASKRAMDESRSGGVGGSRKKRIALTNLSNRGDLAGRPSICSSKVQASQVTNNLLEEEVPEADGEVYVPTEAGLEPVDEDLVAMASLERRTEQKLRISQDSVPEEVEVERRGWSSMVGYLDIDADASDPQMCSVYAKDIYDYLRQAECKRRPAIDFMENLQQDINSNMRGILVDWLVEVAEEYKLVPDTLYLTVSYIDRFLTTSVVTRSRLQLLGVSCMLIAAKYEEIYAPQVEEFCYITDNTYRKEEVLEMERCVLNELHFELTMPTTKSFLRRFIRAAQAGQNAGCDLRLEFLGNFLAELTLAEYTFLTYQPSRIAAAAVFMARYTLDTTAKPWTSTLQHYTGYSPSQIQECVYAVHALQRNVKNCSLPAVREKYRQHKFKQVATLSPPATLPLVIFEDVRVEC